MKRRAVCAIEKSDVKNEGSEEEDNEVDLCDSWKLMNREITDELYPRRMNAWCNKWNLNIDQVSSYFIVPQNKIVKPNVTVVIQKELMSQVIAIFQRDLTPERWQELATSQGNKVLYVDAVNSTWFWEYWMKTPFCIWPHKLRPFYWLLRCLSADVLVPELVKMMEASSVKIDHKTQGLIRVLQEVTTKGLIINDMLSNAVLVLMSKFHMDHYTLRDFFGTQRLPCCPSRKMSRRYDKFCLEENQIPKECEIHLRLLDGSLGKIHGVYQSAESNDKANLYAIVSKMIAFRTILCCYKISKTSNGVLLWARYVEIKECCRKLGRSNKRSYKVTQQTNVIVARGCSECQSAHFYSLLTGQELNYVPMQEPRNKQEFTYVAQNATLHSWFVHVDVRKQQYQVVSLWRLNTSWFLHIGGDNKNREMHDISTLIKNPLLINSIKCALKLAYYCSMDFAAYLVTNCVVLYVDEHKVLYFNRTGISLPEEISLVSLQHQKAVTLHELPWNNQGNFFIALIGDIAIWIHTFVHVGICSHSVVWFNTRTQTIERDVVCSQIGEIELHPNSHVFVHPHTLDVTILGTNLDRHSGQKHAKIWCVRYQWQKYFEKVSHLLLFDLWMLCWSFIDVELTYQELACFTKTRPVLQQKLRYSHELNVCLSH